MVLGPSRDELIVPVNVLDGSLTEVIDSTPSGISDNSVARRSGFLSVMAILMLLLNVNSMLTVYSTSL